MNDPERFLAEHLKLTRRFFLRTGAACLAGGSVAAVGTAAPPAPALAKVLAKLEPYFTPPADFRDVSRGRPLPHSLPEPKKREVGLTRETWKLEVLSDPDNPATLGKQFTKKAGTALDFEGLLQLADKHAVRFAKVMTCLNIGCPLGMGIWEGVPLRELIWLTRPRQNLRRVFYYGYHNDDPKQLFRSSLPIGRVLEDHFDLPPVILCYKLNGRWLDSQRGGPVRLVVPEAYGFKSVKWLTHVVLTNLDHANDTYAQRQQRHRQSSEDVRGDAVRPGQAEAPASRSPSPATPRSAFPGCRRCRCGFTPATSPGRRTIRISPRRRGATPTPAPPKQWGGTCRTSKIPEGTVGFDPATGQPRTWPLRLGKVHWAALLPGLPAGEYTLRCRTMDEKGHAQPMPRPFRKSGHSAIESVKITVDAG